MRGTTSCPEPTGRTSRPGRRAAGPYPALTGTLVSTHATRRASASLHRPFPNLAGGPARRLPQLWDFPDRAAPDGGGAGRVTSPTPGS